MSRQSGMRYKIRFLGSAKREADRLPGYLRQRARRTIDGLGQDSRPSGAKELRDHPGYYRLHLNGWRIIYVIDHDIQVVWIVALRLKKGPETYKGLPDV